MEKDYDKELKNIRKDEHGSLEDIKKVASEILIDSVKKTEKTIQSYDDITEKFDGILKQYESLYEGLLDDIQTELQNKKPKRRSIRKELIFFLSIKRYFKESLREIGTARDGAMKRKNVIAEQIQLLENLEDANEKLVKDIVVWYLTDTEQALDKTIKDVPLSFDMKRLDRIKKKGYPGVEDDAEKIIAQLELEVSNQK